MHNTMSMYPNYDNLDNAELLWDEQSEYIEGQGKLPIRYLKDLSKYLKKKTPVNG